MKQQTKTKQKAYYHVMYRLNNLNLRYPSQNGKNLTLDRAKSFLKEKVALAIKGVSLLGGKAVILSKAPMKIKIGVTWSNPENKESYTYSIKKTINPIK
jgi:hypothetical protein